MAWFPSALKSLTGFKTDVKIVSVPGFATYDITEDGVYFIELIEAGSTTNVHVQISNDGGSTWLNLNPDGTIWIAGKGPGLLLRINNTSSVQYTFLIIRLSGCTGERCGRY